MASQLVGTMRLYNDEYEVKYDWDHLQTKVGISVKQFLQSLNGEWALETYLIQNKNIDDRPAYVFTVNITVGQAITFFNVAGTSELFG